MPSLLPSLSFPPYHRHCPNPTSLSLFARCPPSLSLSFTSRTPSLSLFLFHPADAVCFLSLHHQSCLRAIAWTVPLSWPLDSRVWIHFLSFFFFLTFNSIASWLVTNLKLNFFNLEVTNCFVVSMWFGDVIIEDDLMDVGVICESLILCTRCLKKYLNVSMCFSFYHSI